VGTLLCPFPSPALNIAPAVLLSWPGEDDGWTVEFATSVDGPWVASDATPFMQHGRHSIAVPTDNERWFFRLAFLTIQDLIQVLSMDSAQTHPDHVLIPNYDLPLPLP
jgi:hypothetical protein